MPLLQSRILFRSDNTDGDTVHNDATPTMALMTRRAKIWGTTLKTMMVETRVNATMMTGPSSSPQGRNGINEVECPFSEDTVIKSASLCRKADSCSTMGACSAIHSRYVLMSASEAGSRLLVRLL